MKTIELTDSEAQRLRRMLTRDTYNPPGSIQRVLLDRLESAGVTAPNTVGCPACTLHFGSEDKLYNHLRSIERYPEEDAGSTASREWRTR